MTYTVVQVDPNTLYPTRKLYTGRTYEECKQIVCDLLRRDNRWSLDNLSILDDSTGRHMSIVLR